jgi:hypothetical protein
VTPIAVPATDLPQWLPLIWDYLEDFCADGAMEPVQLVDEIASRDRQLWLAWDGRVRAVMLTQVLADNLNTVRVTNIQGDGMPEWLHLFGVVEEWARECGAKRIQAIGREGWARVIGMRKTHAILEKRL